MKVKEREELRNAIIEDQKKHIKKINNFMICAYQCTNNKLSMQEIKSNLILRGEKLERKIRGNFEDSLFVEAEISTANREKLKVERDLEKIGDINSKTSNKQKEPENKKNYDS